ncbi:hypothetical protein HPP92_023707 [Vanilla planifolia]|uniref:Uncharacterized protein n=1 Tax=Vanilla planifolia TaxID=51239 RepID=A0A835UAN1_VANPL|nr:hypothetical protein HPP92_023707 [Vanilla planifolia]
MERTTHERNDSGVPAVDFSAHTRVYFSPPRSPPSAKILPFRLRLKNPIFESFVVRSVNGNATKSPGEGEPVARGVFFGVFRREQCCGGAAADAEVGPEADRSRLLSDHVCPGGHLLLQASRADANRVGGDGGGCGCGAAGVSTFTSSPRGVHGEEHDPAHREIHRAQKAGFQALRAPGESQEPEGDQPSDAELCRRLLAQEAGGDAVSEHARLPSLIPQPRDAPIPDPSTGLPWPPPPPPPPGSAAAPRRRIAPAEKGFPSPPSPDQMQIPASPLAFPRDFS